MDRIIEVFKSGIHNSLGLEVTPTDSALASENFETSNGKISLIKGVTIFGSQEALGSNLGLHKGKDTNGNDVIYAIFGDTLKYWNGTTWATTATGFDSEDYSFANYSSLAGEFTFVNGPNRFIKLNNANPDTPIEMYNSTKNFYGDILINKGRMILWNRHNDKTGFYGSKIDPQDGTVYTTISSEAIGALGATHYTGTLAFKAGGASRNSFAVTFTATVSAGTELFTDNLDGTLTSNFGGTGTINYASGAYDITFSDTTTSAVTSDYLYEDSTAGGIADFTKSATRNAGEGFQFPQDIGGDKILNVLIGLDGAYFSIKQNSIYRLSILEDDVTADNNIYRTNIGIPTKYACISTDLGILMVDTSQGDTSIQLLEQNAVGNNVKPKKLFVWFDFDAYTYDDAFMTSYHGNTLIFCKKTGSTFNDSIISLNITKKTVDVFNYRGRRASLLSNGEILVGDSLTKTIYKIFDGFNNLDNVITAFWASKHENHGTNRLKKTRYFYARGSIGRSQNIKVFISLDRSDYTQIGTILGDGSYVSFSNSGAIGVDTLGTTVIGGGTGADVNYFELRVKQKLGKYKTRSIKLVPNGFGEFTLEALGDIDILLYENRLPKSRRSKQNVSISGETNQ